MALRVGLLVGGEGTFPPAFLDEVNRRKQGVTAELVKLGGTRMNEPCPYAVVVDRISHQVPYYRSYLKNAVLQGTKVVNNPFVWSADDKFFEASLACRLGIAHPKTVVLPNKDYGPGIVHAKSLRNLVYPLDWQGIVDYVGLPCVLKDAHDVGGCAVAVCHSIVELIHHYNQSGLLTLVVQQFIAWDHFVRCLCLGQQDVLPMQYDPHEHRFLDEQRHLGPELGRRLVDDSLKLMRTLDYHMNSVEWAVKDGVPYALDIMNPTPDLDVHSLTPEYFEWAVKHVADLVIRLATQKPYRQRDTAWKNLF